MKIRFLEVLAFVIDLCIQSVSSRAVHTYCVLDTVPVHDMNWALGTYFLSSCCFNIPGLLGRHLARVADLSPLSQEAMPLPPVLRSSYNVFW